MLAFLNSLKTYSKGLAETFAYAKSIRFNCLTNNTDQSSSIADNRLHDNKGLVGRAVEAGQCLYQVSGNSCYPMHDFYRYVSVHRG